MAKPCLKKPSKRVPLKRKYKIEKRIREHNRKKRKEAKRLARKPSRKLIHIPHGCPFKEDILKDAEIYKEHIKEERNGAWESAIAVKKENAEKAKDLQQLAAIAEQKEMSLSEPSKDKDLVVRKTLDGQRKTYYREFQKVVISADVILEVVDARDPLGTRCPTVEQCVRDAGDGKRLVLVLNKADLVPRAVLDKWLKHLRKSLPCIPFKSSTQTQSKKLGRRKMKAKQNVENNAVCIGAEGLTSLLANYTRNKGIKTSIRVGVVGLPNVGKSSLINSLKRSRACKVGALPGITRSLQEVQLDSKIKLLDCPGLALASPSDPQAALKNAVLTNDCIGPAEMIITRASKENLMRLYYVSNFESSTEFLSSLAKRYGKFKKGGVVDLHAAAKILVNDWNRGKIVYHVEPPEESKSHEVSSCIITSGDVAEFDLDAYDAKVFPLKEEEEMEVCENNESAEKGKADNFVITVKQKKTKNEKKEEAEKRKNDSLMKLEGNLKQKKLMKLRFKKMKKQKARSEKTTSELADNLDSFQLGN